MVMPSRARIVVVVWQECRQAWTKTGESNNVLSPVFSGVRLRRTSFVARHQRCLYGSEECRILDYLCTELRQYLFPHAQRRPTGAALFKFARQEKYGLLGSHACYKALYQACLSYPGTALYPYHLLMMSLLLLVGGLSIDLEQLVKLVFATVKLLMQGRPFESRSWQRVILRV